VPVLLWPLDLLLLSLQDVLPASVHAQIIVAPLLKRLAWEDPSLADAQNADQAPGCVPELIRDPDLDVKSHLCFLLDEGL